MKNIFLGLVLLIILLPSCQEEYFLDGGIAEGKLNMTTYDFIQSRPDMFEKLLWIIDDSNLQEEINREGNTFFPPKDQSIVDYLEANQLESVQLEKLPQEEKDKLGEYLKKYIFPLKIMRKDMTGDMKEYIALSDDAMSIGLQIEPYKEIPGFGPSTVILSGDRQMLLPGGVIATFTFNAFVATSDLETSNGAVHVLRETGHIFGF